MMLLFLLLLLIWKIRFDEASPDFRLRHLPVIAKNSPNGTFICHHRTSMLFCFEASAASIFVIIKRFRLSKVDWTTLSFRTTWGRHLKFISSQDPKSKSTPCPMAALPTNRFSFFCFVTHVQRDQIRQNFANLAENYSSIFGHFVGCTQHLAKFCQFFMLLGKFSSL